MTNDCERQGKSFCLGHTLVHTQVIHSFLLLGKGVPAHVVLLLLPLEG